MAVYSEKKRKTPGKVFWRICSQIAGSLGVFFLVVTIFQSTSPESLQWQQWIRHSFTTDADLGPVVQFFYQMDSPYEEAAVRVNAAAYPVQEAMAVPVTGKVLQEYSGDNAQMSSRFAEGLWIAAAPDEQICAAYSGTVTGLWQENGMYTVELSHANGYITVYGCCAQTYVQLNQPVEKGQIIGCTKQQEKEGNFYFAARYLGEPVNPLELLEEKTVR